MKRRRRTPRKRKRTGSDLWESLQNAIWPKLLQPLWLKSITTIVLVLVSLPLFWTFISQQDTNAQYVLALSLISLILLIWALPNVKLGLAAVFLFTQPLLIYLGNTEYGYTKAIYSLGFISLLAVVWVGEMARKGRADIKLTALFWPAILLLAAALLSLINSQTLLGDLQYVLLFIYFFLLYLFLANILEHPEEIHFLLGALLISAVLASLYGLLQYYGILPGTPGENRGTWNIISTFGNKNYLGGFLSYLVVPGLLLLFSAHSRWVKIFTSIAMALLFITLLAIDSDSAWLASILSLGILLGGLWLLRGFEPLRQQWRWSVVLVGVTGLLTLWLLFGTAVWVQGVNVSMQTIKRIAGTFSAVAWAGLAMVALIAVIAWLEKLFRSRQRRWGWIGLATAGLALLVGALTPLGQDLAATLYQQAVRSSANVRAWDWWVGYHMFEDHPIVGIGVGDYKREFLLYKAEFLTTERGQNYANTVGYIVRAAQAHNEYVQIMAEMGILGLLATAFFIATLIWSTLARLRANTSSEGTVMIIALFAGVVAFMSDSLFSFPLHLPANVLVLVFLLAALQSRALDNPKQPPLHLSLGKRMSWVMAAVAFLVASTVSVFAYRDWQADVYLDQAQRLVKGGGSRDTVQEVKELLQKSLTLDVDPGEVLYWLGLMYMEEGDFLKGKELLERSLPRFATETSYLQLASVNLRLAQIERAKGASANPELIRRYREEARDYLEQLLAIDPDPSLKVEALHLKALVLFEEGKGDEALSLLEDLRQGNPDAESLLVTSGQIYLSRGEMGKARQAFEQALVVIDKKLAQLQTQLSAVGTQVPLDDYYRWKAEQEKLETLKRNVEEALRRLPQ